MTRGEFIQRMVIAYKQVDGAIKFADDLEKREVAFDEPEELEPADDDELDALLVALDEMIASMMDGEPRMADFVTVNRERFRAVVRARAALQGDTNE